MIYSLEMLNKRKRYYSQIYIQFELLKAMKYKEVMFMSKSNNNFCIRGLFITNLEMLHKIFDVYHFYEKDYNIYCSSAHYKKLPVFGFDLTKRSAETKAFFYEDCYPEIYDYDLLLDFDLDLADNSFFKLLNDVRKIWQILYNNKIRFNCFFSGSGVQIIILGDDININKEFFKYDPETDTRQPFNYNIKLLTKNMKSRFNLKSLCLKGLGTIHKVRKCEYSLVNDRVVFPVYSVRLLEEFAQFDFDCIKIMQQVFLKGRGLCVHTYQDKNNSFRDFLKKYRLEDGLKW